MQLTITGARGGCTATTVAACLALEASRYDDTALTSHDPETLAGVLGLPELTPETMLASHALTFDPEALARLQVRECARAVDLRQPTAVGEAIPAGTGPIYTVTRLDYLDARAIIAAPRVDGLIVLVEPGRALTVDDLADVTGLPIIGTVDHDPAVARAVDAGLLSSRRPRRLERSMAEILRAVAPEVLAR